MKSPFVFARARRPVWLAALVLALASGCGVPGVESTAAPAQSASPAAASVSAAAAALSSPSPEATVAPSLEPSAAAPSASPAAASPSSAPSAEAPAASTADSEFSAQRALETVRLLSETIGSRPAGSDAERRAADALADAFRTLGWSVELQEFPVVSFEDRGSSVRVGDASQTTIAALALQNSANGSVSGRLVPAGLGRPEDLSGLDLAGAVALIERGEITFADKVRNVADAGAAGAVIYNQDDESFRGMLPDPSSIPAVGIDGVTGRRLAEQAAQSPLVAELSVDASIAQTVSHNVVATLGGSSDETVILGAHYDSVAEGPGANDNASGSATVLELARVLTSDPPPYTVAAILFGAEEIGLVGSRYYVDSLSPQQRESVAAMLNFDMVGVGDRAMVGGSDDLVQLAREAGDEQGVEVGELGSDLNGRSDHAPFLGAGIPTIFFHRLDDPRYHTADDQAQYVQAEGIQVAGDLALAVLDAVAVP